MLCLSKLSSWNQKGWGGGWGRGSWFTTRLLFCFQITIIEQIWLYVNVKGRPITAWCNSTFSQKLLPLKTCGGRVNHIFIKLKISEKLIEEAFITNNEALVGHGPISRALAWMAESASALPRLTNNSTSSNKENHDRGLGLLIQLFSVDRNLTAAIKSLHVIPT